MCCLDALSCLFLSGQRGHGNHAHNSCRAKSLGKAPSARSSDVDRRLLRVTGSSRFELDPGGLIEAQSPSFSIR